MIYKHPEWRRLYEACAANLVIGQTISYEDLLTLADIDIKTARGRGQFYRFADEVLRTLNLHFECIRNIGYRVVSPPEHARCSMNEFGKARRRMHKANEIVTHVRIEHLNQAEITLLANVQVRTARIQEMLENQSHQLTKISDKLSAMQRLPSPMREKAEAEKQEPEDTVN